MDRAAEVLCRAMNGKRSSLHRQLNISPLTQPKRPRWRRFTQRSQRLLVTTAVATALVAVSIPSASAGGMGACKASASDALVGVLSRQAPSLKPDVLQLALNASLCAAEQGHVKRSELLTVIDYSIPSTEPRLWVFDLPSKRVLFEEHVAHGVNSGHNRTTKFSNTNGSRQTSLGLFVTQETYFGQNGYSLRLAGLDQGFNDRARARAIVMHGAPYVNPKAAKSQGRLGRSWGCPAVRKEVAKNMIDKLKDGSPVFAYYPDDRWLSSSRFLVR